MDQVKKPLKKYQDLYPELNKDFCRKIWLDPQKRKKDSELFFSFIKEKLKPLASSEKEIFSQLSKEAEEKTRELIKESIEQTLERMATNGNSSHKLQAVFGPLAYQKYFAPGGFKQTELFKKHQENFQKKLSFFIKNACSLNGEHIVFSNEALDIKRYPQTKYETILKRGGSKEFYAATFLKEGSEVKHQRKLFRENYFLEIKRKNHVFFTSHFSSIKEEDREERSEFFCQKRLKKLILLLKEEAEGIPFSFSGDINLYFFQGKERGRFLRKEVLKLLKEENLVLITSSGMINKSTRPKLHDQWHKVNLEENEENIKLRPDSLVVLEPYEKNFSYEKLRENGLGAKQDIFFPNGESWVQKVSKPQNPFGEEFIMDHIPIRGQLVSILNGADGDGTGNEAKKFLGLKPSFTEDSSYKKLHLKAMAACIEATCSFIEEMKSRNLT